MKIKIQDLVCFGLCSTSKQEVMNVIRSSLLLICAVHLVLECISLEEPGDQLVLKGYLFHIKTFETYICLCVIDQLVKVFLALD